MYIYHILSVLFMFRVFKHYTNHKSYLPLHLKMQTENTIPLNRRKRYDTLLITRRDNKTYDMNSVDQFLLNNPGIQNKHVITLSPGGYKGFYMMGIVHFMKKHYDLSNYVFSGASAGAWNSLLMAFKYDMAMFKYHIMDDTIQNAQSISDMEQLFKEKLLRYYTTNDFDLEKLFIGVTSIKDKHPHTMIYTKFATLEDAIDCCIASSHIPWLTGNLTHKYNGLFTFDGGFSKYPYFNISKPVLHITPSIWMPPKTNSIKKIHDYTTLFSKDLYKFSEICDKGYADSYKNKVFLDNIFLSTR